MSQDETVEVSFSFGENWESFIAGHFSEERARIAREHLMRFLELQTLAGKCFVDVGCGSGLSSLAAFDAGAERIVSFDVDPASVKTTAALRRLRGDPDNWTVMHGSVLDREFLRKIEPGDIVYSWGVLHHTGSMWEAIENAAALLKPGASLFYIALYVTTNQSGYWTAKKKKYNAASSARKRRMVIYSALRHQLLPLVVRGKNPIRYIREYRNRRGMELMTDVRDWLGGYPCEFSTIPEVMSFCRKKLDLELINLNPDPGFAEYLFAPRGAGAAAATASGPA